jgi:mannose-6-phosphate isomerase-like protein (cupin superfamily)
VTGPTRIVLYIVSGTGEVRIGKLTAKAGPGDVFVIPAGARHAVRAQTGPLRAIYVETRLKLDALAARDFATAVRNARRCERLSSASRW